MTVLRMYTDGAARGNPGPSGLGVLIEDDAGVRVRALCRYIGTATNNRAEYLALIEGLRAASELRPDALDVFMDSKLVVEQVNGRYKVKEPSLQPLHREARRLIDGLPSVTVAHVERARNRAADALANRAIDDWKGP